MIRRVHIHRFVAFLRAMNIGGHVVTMEDLRRHVAKAGAREVETFIASGNVIFGWPSDEPHRAEAKIQEGLRKALGYDVKTFIRRPSEVAAIARYRPFSEPAMQAARVLVVGFLSEPLDGAATDTLMSFTSDVDDFHTSGREIYWLCKVGQSESPFFKIKSEKRLGVQVTLRNMNTIQRLVTKYDWT